MLSTSAPVTQLPLVDRNAGKVKFVVRARENQTVEGKLPVGTRLPPECEVPEQLGVSRPAGRGRLKTQRRNGTTVRAFRRSDVIEQKTLSLRTQGQEFNIQQLHQIHSVLEVENVLLAARLSKPEDVECLKLICDAMESVRNDAAEFTKKDAEFHQRPGLTTHNQQDLFERVMPTHLQIGGTVAAHDETGARHAMQQHLEIALSLRIEAAAKSLSQVQE